jgi:2-polyprenyl-3-methyl-5-hydroxy-6-metoxy-1,4-benzoquinol methylase
MKMLIEDYYNSHYKHVNEDFNIDNYKKTLIREHGDILKNKNKKILDIGCGAGFLLRVLEEQGFKNLVGVEIDASQANEAKKGLSHSFIFNEDVFSFFNNNKEKYDIVFLYDLIEHINKENIVPLLKLIHNSLNMDGIIIIKTPNADSPLFASRMRYLDFTHEILFNKESIEMVLREAGFKDISCKGQKTFFSIGKILSWPIRFFGDSTIRLYLATYIGWNSFRLILTPNFIITAKK